MCLQVEKLSRDRVHIGREQTQELQHLREAHAAQMASVEGDKCAVKEELDDVLARLKQSKVDLASQVCRLLCFSARLLGYNPSLQDVIQDNLNNIGHICSRDCTPTAAQRFSLVSTKRPH